MADQPDWKLEFKILTRDATCKCGTKLNAADARIYRNGFLIVCPACHRDSFGVKVTVRS
jgi:hypothetical protein